MQIPSHCTMPNQTNPIQLVAHTLGRVAEDLTVRYLKKQGFKIMVRNYRYRRAEIDIIAQKSQLLIFVEVKARRSDRFGNPETFVGAKQQTLIRTAAEHYIITHDWDYDIRFDIVAVCQQFNNQLKLTHFEDAFY